MHDTNNRTSCNENKNKRKRETNKPAINTEHQKKLSQSKEATSLYAKAAYQVHQHQLAPVFLPSLTSTS